MNYIEKLPKKYQDKVEKITFQGCTSGRNYGIFSCYIKGENPKYPLKETSINALIKALRWLDEQGKLN